MPTTPVSPERRIVLTNAGRHDQPLHRKFSDEVLDYEIDWTAVISGDPIVGEVEATANGGVSVVSVSTTENVTRLRLSGGSRIYAVATIDLLAITQDGERIGCRLKLPVTFREAATGPVSRFLTGALLASSSLTGSLSVDEASVVSLVGTVASAGAFEGALTLEASYAIWDTDIDSDCDDVAATALLGRYLDTTGSQLIAAAVASNNEYAAPALKAMLTYLGLGSVPVGAYQGSSIGGGNASRYTLEVRNAFRPGETRANYDEAVGVLAEALTAAPDRSVTYIIGGTCTNLAALLAAEPELCAAKIKLVSVMGGLFPSVQTSENNVGYDVPAANAVASSGLNVVWAGAEAAGSVMTRIPMDGDANHDPFKLAWDLSASQQTNGRRNSWDLAAVVYGLLGTADIFSLSAPGNLSFSPEGYTNFSANPAGKNRYLIKTKTNDEIAAIWDADIETILDSRDTFPPIITSSASPSITEGETLNLTFTASEALASAEIIGGEDADLFTLDGLTLTLPTAAGQAGISRGVEVRIYDTNGNYTDQAITVSITSAAGIPSDMLLHYKLDEGVGAVVNDSGAGGRNGVLSGSTFWVDAAGGDGSPKVGVAFVGGTSGRNLVVGNDTGLQSASFHAFIACDITTIATAVGILMAKDNIGSSQRSWLFNTTSTGGSLLSFTGRGASPKTISVPITAGSGWHTYEVEVNALAVTLRQDGVVLATTTLNNTIPATTANLTLGNKESGGSNATNSFAGTLGAALLYPRPLSASEAAGVRDAIKTDMAAKGVSLP